MAQIWGSWKPSGSKRFLLALSLQDSGFGGSFKALTRIKDVFPKSVWNLLLELTTYVGLTEA